MPTTHAPPTRAYLRRPLFACRINRSSSSTRAYSSHARAAFERHTSLLDLPLLAGLDAAPVHLTAWAYLLVSVSAGQRWRHQDHGTKARSPCREYIVLSSSPQHTPDTAAWSCSKEHDARVLFFISFFSTSLFCLLSFSHFFSLVLRFFSIFVFLRLLSLSVSLSSSLTLVLFSVCLVIACSFIYVPSSVSVPVSVCVSLSHAHTQPFYLSLSSWRLFSYHLRSLLFLHRLPRHPRKIRLL